MLFKNLDIIKPIQKALEEIGYTETTPIQEQSIPSMLNKRDFIGCAQTGTGKTAAFAIPILQNIAAEKNITKGPRVIRSLIIAPTRELAIQIGDSFNSYGKYLNIRTVVIFGGVPQKPQTNALKNGIDIVIATPGRMLDLYNQKFIDLRNVKYFVLDEADRMLDMGMIHDVKRIISNLPKIRQNMLFSATMPEEITNLVNSIVVNPIKVEVTPISSTADIISQKVFHVDKNNKKSLLKYLLKDNSIMSALVFSRTKHGANSIVKDLVKSGFNADAIHGNKSQNARQRALNDFKEGRIKVLVATDIAARGIDVNELSHVINFDLPEVPETYVHRIGRTGRAGFKGDAYSFCDTEEKDYLKNIEKLINKSIPVTDDHPYKAVGETVPAFKNRVSENIPYKKNIQNKKFGTNRNKSNGNKKYREINVS